ncbi:Translation machinery-associated protein 16 [Madurella mycetomatis]|uniref:Translation machinery-associated protein 16 n=1 Tax=Madurella mycetomatis TaxID=100816 RepID=A0A175VV34_9PEZI|nr:Translation machinery-associated protein 16 [Madurella mycetomatis]
MAKTLEKTRKQIAKKRNGTVEALHQKSRDSKRLHRAQVRDDRLEKIAEARRKKTNLSSGKVNRAAFFQEFVREHENKALELDVIQSKISEFVHQHDEEYEAIKKARRPGRPPSTKEDILRMKISALEKEQRDGFYMPDLTLEQNVELLSRWEGSWSYLTNLAWVKVSVTGTVKPSSFPPQGL